MLFSVSFIPTRKSMASSGEIVKILRKAIDLEMKRKIV